MDYQEIVLEVDNYVSTSDKAVPLTGIQSENIEGWVWNRRTSSSSTRNNTRYLTHVGGHAVGLLDGTKLTHWQSGVLDGIQYDSIVHMPLGDDLSWTPRYSVGGFSVYWDYRNLYSDYSYSESADWDVNGRTALRLRTDAVHNSVSAALYKRLDTYEISSIREARLVSAFTGALTNGARLELNDGLPADWSQVEIRKREMLVEDGVLYFNQDMSIQVGAEYSTVDDILESWEHQYDGLREGRPLFLQYFPLSQGSVELVSIDSSGNITTWEEQPSLNFSSPVDKHFSVNYDLGTINTGGYQAPSLVLAETVEAYDVEIRITISENLDSYPEQGVVVIGSEEIYYLGKTRDAFTNCVRGFNNTIAQDHTKGTIVSDRQHGLHTTDAWYVKYKAVPRVDYEVTDYNLRTANHSTWLDVRALRNTKANNIVQIVSQDSNLAEVILTSDSPLIGANLFGPVYYGTDVSKLTATGFDAAGNPVEDVDLTIYIKSGTGQLNGSLSSYTAESNTAGQVSCFYNAPYSNDDAIMEVTKTEHVGADTHMTVNFTTTVVPSEVWVFQILKHDPVLGTVGNRVDVVALGSATEPHGLGYADVYMKHTDDYNKGTLLLQDSSGVRRSLPVRWAELQYDGNSEPYVRFFLEVNPSASWISGTQPAWLFQQEAVEWDSALKRGARVILYEYTLDAQHPITGNAGAYMPVRPTAVQGNTLVFENRLLGVPDPADDETNLGAYVIIAPSEVRCGAYGRDPYTGRLITSNDVRLRLQLPNTLTGVDSSGALPIPYGWTFITEDFNIGAGLDGANFITINPAASGINQFSLQGAV